MSPAAPTPKTRFIHPPPRAHAARVPAAPSQHMRHRQHCARSSPAPFQHTLRYHRGATACHARAPDPSVLISCTRPRRPIHQQRLPSTHAMRTSNTPAAHQHFLGTPCAGTATRPPALQARQTHPRQSGSRARAARAAPPFPPPPHATRLCHAHRLPRVTHLPTACSARPHRLGETTPPRGETTTDNQPTTTDNQPTTTDNQPTTTDNQPTAHQTGTARPPEII